MPILKDFRKTKEIVLPSYEDSKLEVYDSILVGDISTIDFKSNDIEQIIQSLPLFIKKWNFTDEDGKDMPITRENLNFLQMADVQYLTEEIMKFNEESKKKPSDSQPSA